MPEPCEDTVSFPTEDYRQQRRDWTPTESIIPYKPINDPAWARHRNELAPKPQRFSKLHHWDQSRSNIQKKIAIAVAFAAGAAACAGPAVTTVLNLPH